MSTVAISEDVTPPPEVRSLPRRTVSLPPSHTCNRGQHVWAMLAACTLKRVAEQVGFEGLPRDDNRGF